MTEIAEPSSLDVKQAVRRAFSYVTDVFPTEQIKDLRLEEVEQTEDGKYWLVTVGLSTPVVATVHDPISNLEKLASPFAAQKFQRDYKQLKIDARTGQVLSMKIRVP